MSKPLAVPKPLTLSFVRHVTTPGKFYDGDGLILIVSPNGAKSWMQRLTILGRRRDIGIGSAISLTPAAARTIAEKNKAIARAGGNPLDQSADMRAPLKTLRVMTLAHFALTLWRRQQALGAALSEAKKDYRLVKAHVTPHIGRRPVAEITVAEIRAVLEQIFKENANTGEAVRTRLMHLFDAVIEEKHRTDNPARSPIARPEKKRKRTTVEGDDRNIRVFGILPNFMKDLMESPRRPTLLRMVRFIILSLRNPKECRLATWDQIDLDNRTWRFPSMQKEGAEIIEVGLHDGLMAILADMKPLRRGDGLGWVFPSSLNFSEPFSLHATQHITIDFNYDMTMRDFVRVFEWRQAAMGEEYGMEEWYREMLSPT